MSEERIALLKERSKRCVCKYCGNRLHLKRIIFSEIEEAQIELYCEYCDRIEFGVEWEVYQCAKNLVEEQGFNYYQELDDTEQVKRMNIAKLCEIIEWADQKRGFSDRHGFKVPIKLDNKQQGGLSFYCVKDLKER